jgi:hypothetical protein
MDPDVLHNKLQVGCSCDRYLLRSAEPTAEPE